MVLKGPAGAKKNKKTVPMTLAAVRLSSPADQTLVVAFLRDMRELEKEYYNLDKWAELESALESMHNLYREITSGRSG